VCEREWKLVCALYINMTNKILIYCRPGRTLAPCKAEIILFAFARAREVYTTISAERYDAMLIDISHSIIKSISSAPGHKVYSTARGPILLSAKGGPCKNSRDLWKRYPESIKTYNTACVHTHNTRVRRRIYILFLLPAPQREIRVLILCCGCIIKS